MNIYWFASGDNSIVEPVLAPDEEVARRILSSTENPLPMEDYELVGVSKDVGTGEPRALAEILGDFRGGTTVY